MHAFLLFIFDDLFFAIDKKQNDELDDRLRAKTN